MCVNEWEAGGAVKLHGVEVLKVYEYYSNEQRSREKKKRVQAGWSIEMSVRGAFVIE